MLFNSLHFLIYFPIVTLFFFSLSHRVRIFFLLAASCYFYMYFVPKYILILALTIVIDFWAGLVIEKNEGKKRKLFFVLSLCANIGILGFFKYFNFFNENVAEIARFLNWHYPIRNLEILLPIGLSFHTFQSMSYTFEVYRRNQKSEKDFWVFALYVMFYPQLVAGPIERPQNLLHQFHEVKVFQKSNLVAGLQLMIWGFFKKVVVADRLAIYVNQVYGQPMAYGGLALAVATFFFAIQIYCDFSGYSEIAIGSARVMGFDLMRNFNRPYFAKSIKEFWSRWHISLSAWFKDYVYFPLGGNRVSSFRRNFNLFTVFVLSGIWHGASWNFVIWGVIHGIYQIFSVTLSTLKSPFSIVPWRSFDIARDIGKMLFTFILVCIAWVFFRAETLSQAIHILKTCFTSISFSRESVAEAVLPFTGDSTAISQFLFAIFIIVFLFIMEWKTNLGKELNFSPNQGRYAEVMWATLVLFILFFGEFSSQSFIYFQF